MINKKTTIILLIIMIVLIVAPLYLKSGSAFEGADGLAEEAIMSEYPDYVPWINSLFEPPSGEIESLLFSLQAAMGAGIITYIIGYYRGKNAIR
jgi:cobalt/nickel transport protein